MKPQIGLQLSSLTPYLKTEESISLTLKKVSNMGYRYVQLQGVPAEIGDRFLAESLQQNNLSCVATQEDYIFGFGEHYENAIQRAVACGAQYLAFALIPREVNSVSALAEFAHKISHIGECAGKTGLKFSFHPIGSDYELLDGIPRYERLLNLLPGLGLTFCISATFSSRVSIEEVFEKFGDRIDIVHFKEYVVLPDGQKQLVPLGHGEHDWNHYYELCQKHNVSYIFAEQEYWQGDAFDAICTSLQYLRKLVDE